MAFPEEKAAAAAHPDLFSRVRNLPTIRSSKEAYRTDCDFCGGRPHVIMTWIRGIDQKGNRRGWQACLCPRCARDFGADLVQAAIIEKEA